MLTIFATSNIHYEVPELGISGRDFPSISITGKSCDLMCKHCHGKLLSNMLQVSLPDELKALGMRLRNEGVSGVLISGGCDYLGRVPFEAYVDAIKYLKGLGMKVFLHSGVVDDERANLIKQLGIDAVLIDLVVHEGAIREVIGLNNVDAYLESFRTLITFDLPVIPHIIIGLYKGLPSKEFEAVDIIRTLSPKAAVFVIFTPYPGTPLELLNAPSPQYVIKLLRYGRKRLDDMPLSLGCMRPRDESFFRVEMEAVKLGFDGISFPSTTTLSYIVKNDIKFRVVNECCASIFNYVNI